MPQIQTPTPLDPNDGISPQIWAWLNTWPNKPTDMSSIGVGLDHVDKAVPAMTLHQISGTIVTRQYMDGGFIGSWPFAIFVKVQGEDTAARLSAVAVLNDLYKWMKANPPTNIGTNKVAYGITQSETPVRIARYEDGTEIYQSLYVLQYQQKGEN